MSDLDRVDAMDDLGTSDPKKVGKAKKRADTNEKILQEYWRRVLDTPEGRAVLWEVLENCGVFARSFAGENTHLTAHSEGRRHVGIDIFERLLQVAPQSYNLMRQEALKRNETRED